MGNCDWDDRYPPPKKCGYVGTWTGGGGGGWNIPPIDVDDDDWTPPPPIDVDQSWYCNGSYICLPLVNGSSEAQAALSGPYDTGLECNIECRPTYRVLCTYKGTVHWQCDPIMFGPDEIIPEYINIPGDLYGSMEDCQVDCPPSGGPSKKGWQCDLKEESGGDPECSFVTRGDVNDNGTYLHRTEGLCMADCKKGRWECVEHLEKCFWNANAPKAETLIEKNELICDLYCKPPIKPTPNAPSTPGSGRGCSYVYCDMEQDPPKCEQGSITADSHPRLDANGDVIEAHKGLYREVHPHRDAGGVWIIDCDSDAMKSLIKSLGGTTVPGGCNEDNCPPPKRGPITPGAPASPTTLTSDSGDWIKCNISTNKCDIRGTWTSDDFPWKDSNGDIISDNADYYDERGRWLAHDGNQNGRDLRTRIAASLGGFPDTAAGIEACEKICGSTPTSPHTDVGGAAGTGPPTPQSGNYWYCNKSSYTCVRVPWIQSDIERNFPNDGNNDQLYNPQGQFRFDAGQPQRVADLFGGFNDTGPDSKDDCEKECENNAPATPASPSAPSSPSGPGIKGSYLICITKGESCKQKWWYASNFPSTNPAYASFYDTRGRWDMTSEAMADFLEGFPDTAEGQSACDVLCALNAPSTPDGGGGEELEPREGSWIECDPHYFTCFVVTWIQDEFPPDRHGSYWSRGRFIATDEQVRLDHATDGGWADTDEGMEACQRVCKRVYTPSTPDNTIGGELDVWYCDLDGDCDMVTISVGREISDPNWVVPDNERGQAGFWGEGAHLRCNNECPDPVATPPPAAPSTGGLRPDRFNCATGGEGGCTSVSPGSPRYNTAWVELGDCIENCPKKPPGGDDAQLPPSPSTGTGGGGGGTQIGDADDAGLNAPVTPDNPDEDDDIEQAARFICNTDGTCSLIDDRHADWDWAYLSLGDCEAVCVASPRWVCTRGGCMVIDFRHPAYHLGFSTSLECQMACPPPPITDAGDNITDGGDDDGGEVDGGDHGWRPSTVIGTGGDFIDPDCVFGGTHMQWVCDEETHTCKTVEVPINVTYFDDAISCLNYCNRNPDIDSEYQSGSFNNISNEGLHGN